MYEPRTDDELRAALAEAQAESDAGGDRYAEGAAAVLRWLVVGGVSPVGRVVGAPECPLEVAAARELVACLAVFSGEVPSELGVEFVSGVEATLMWRAGVSEVAPV